MQIAPVPATWYASLPRDPDLSTQAFLSRVPAAMRDRGEAVSRSRYWALVLRVTVSLGALVLFLFCGAARKLAAASAGLSRYRWVQALAFTLVLLAYSFVMSLPVEAWASYARYRGFGFSNQPFAGWLQDYVTGWASTAVFYATGIVIIALLMRKLPRTWFLCAGCVYFVLATIDTAATPIWIEPLTNTYSPLPDSLLKQDILKMAQTAGVPARDVYTDDASRQSRRLNGHVSGMFGTARITIDDTAIGSYPAAVKALAAHEMGHYVMRHPLKMVLLEALIETLGLAMIAAAMPLLLRNFGARWGIHEMAATGAIAVFWLLFTAWGFAADPVTNAYARMQERQADNFALDLSREPLGLAEFMIQDADIGRLVPTKVDVLLFYDHPSDAERVWHAMQWRAAHPEID